MYREKLKHVCFSGPLKETVDDFWLMVFQYNCPTIVMLCNCYENNMNKSWQYWPLDVGHTMVLGEDRDGIELEVSYVHLEDRDHYLVRSFILTDTASGEKRKVKQFHYLDWPDFNVPKSPKYFLEFLYAIRESGCFSENSGPPVGKLSSIEKSNTRTFLFMGPISVQHKRLIVKKTHFVLCGSNRSSRND